MLKSMNRSLSQFAGLIVLILAAGVFTGCESNPFLRKEATDALQDNDVRKADQLISQALAQQPFDGQAQYLMGVIRLRQDRALDAQLCFEQARSVLNGQTVPPGAVDPMPAVLDGLAESLYRQHNNSRLVSFLKDSATEYCRSRDFLRQADYLIRLGDLDGAKLAMKKAQRLAEPTDEQPYLKMAELYDSLGDKDNALTAVRTAYFIKPKSPKVIEALRAHGYEPGPGAGIEPDRTMAK